jgi:type IV secretion system protein VirB10
MIEDTASSLVHKLPAEPLEFRGSPGRAIRFRRGAILAFIAGALALILAASWLALRSHAPHEPATNDRYDLAAKPPADELANAPATYGDVPQLGPPLPGDLGKSILENASGLRPTASPSSMATSAGDARQQMQTEQRAARESGLLIRETQRDRPLAKEAAVSGRASFELPASNALDTDRLALDASNDPNAQAHKVGFVAKGEGDIDIDPHVLTRPTSPSILSAGSAIAASLITGLSSDLPGLVTAQVTENVYDSATGTRLLIPQGARLIGSYDSVVAFGQRRALLVWQRIVFPDGSSLHIDNVPASDPSGYGGIADKVDFHSWTLLKGIVLSTLLGVSSNLALSGRGDLVQAIRLSTQDSVSRTGDQITSRNLQVQPTITIRPGAMVRLVVHHDLVLPPWQQEAVR